MSKLYFVHSGYGCDFEAVDYWPKEWPHDIEYPDGYMDYMDGDVWFKAYDTSLKENDRDAELFEQGYLFNCEVRIRYYTSGLYCEDPLASFPARDQEEAERLLQVAADALYEEPSELAECCNCSFGTPYKRLLNDGMIYYDCPTCIHAHE